MTAFVGRASKWIVRVLVWGLVLVAIALFGIYGLLATEVGYRQLPKLVNRFTPYELHYEGLEGKLFGAQQWRNLRLQGNGMVVEANSLKLELGAKALLTGALRIEELSVEGLNIELPEAQEKTESTSLALPEKLPDISLPIDVYIERLQGRDIRILRQGESLFTIHQLLGNAQMVENTLLADLSVESDKADAHLTGKFVFNHDYPLDFALNVSLAPWIKQPFSLALRAEGSALSSVVSLQTTGALTLDSKALATLDLPSREIELLLTWQDALYAQHRLSAGELSLKGALDKGADLALNTALLAEGLPDIGIEGNAQISLTQVKDLSLLLKTLGGEVVLSGEMDYSAAPTWDLRLNARDIDGAQYQQDWPLRLSAALSSQGTLMDNGLAFHADIHHLQGAWQSYPITGQGAVHFDKDKLTVDGVALNLAGNHIVADGSATMEDSNIRLRVDAPALSQLLPMLSGALAAELDITEQLSNPHIAGQVHWQGLQVKIDDAPAVVRDSAGNVRVKGNVFSGLAVALDAQAEGEAFPLLGVSGSLLATPEMLKEIALEIDGLDGTLALTGEVALDNTKRWDLRLNAAGINPHALNPALSANIDAQVHSTGQFDDAGDVAVEAEIVSLGGQWQGKALSGEGVFEYRVDALAVRDLSLAVGENTLAAHGEIGLSTENNQLNLQTAIRANNLSLFYPALSGKLEGEIYGAGTLTKPLLNGTLVGEKLAFDAHRIASLEARFDTAVQDGGKLNNALVLRDITVAGQTLKSLKLSSEGTIGQHQVRLLSQGGAIADIDVVLAGSLSSLEQWQGKIERLALTGKGLNWRLRHAAPLSIGFDGKVNLQTACLTDQYSALCVSVNKAEQLALRYQLERLDARSFAPFLPEMLTVGVSASGEGDVRINQQGEIYGNNVVNLSKGRLVARLNNQPPVVLTLNEGKFLAEFNRKEAHTLLALDFAETGMLKSELIVADLTGQMRLKGRANVDMPDIGKFAYFIPQVSELRGRIKGNLAIAGTANAPIVSGELSLLEGGVKVPQYATDLHDIRLSIQARESGRLNIDGSVGTPEGDLAIDGVLRIAPLAVELHLQGRNMLLANSERLMVKASPNIHAAIDPKNGVIVVGEVKVTEAKIDIPDTSSGQPISKDVVIVSDKKTNTTKIVAGKSSAPLKIDLKVVLGDKVYFSNKDISIRLIGGLNVLIRPNKEVIGRGVIEVASGIYQFYGRELNIKRGRVTFSGDNIANPTVEVMAVREVDKVSVGAKINGTVQNLRLSLVSTPSMPDSAILSYLVFGRAPDSSMDTNSLLQTAASIGISQLMPDNLAEKTGLDVFDLGLSGLKAGKYLSEDIYVGMQTNFFTGITQFLARYQFTDRLSMEVLSQGSKTAVDFFYQYETD